MPRAVVAATGMHVPARVLSSSQLDEGLGLPRGWIERRTGIRERRIAAPDEATSDLAVAAARAALDRAGWSASELDLCILCTSTPDHPMPPSAPLVLHRLGARRAAGFDLAAACSGFIYGLYVADSAIRSGSARRILLIGANVMSRRVNWNDPDTAAIFGDGAGAVLLEAAPDTAKEQFSPPRGVIATRLRADGSAAGIFLVPAGGSREPLTPEGLATGRDRMSMQGGPLARRAIKAMAELLREALAASGLEAADVDWLVPHQANLRIIESLAHRLGFPMARVVVNVDRYGNTSAASIPIALHEAGAAGRLQPGQTVALVAFGGGLTTAAALLRW